MGNWRREFPDKYYGVDNMGYGYRAGNYIFEELLIQIKQLKAENEKLKEENEKLKNKEESAFSEILKRGD